MGPIYGIYPYLIFTWPPFDSSRQCQSVLEHIEVEDDFMNDYENDYDYDNENEDQDEDNSLGLLVQREGHGLINVMAKKKVGHSEHLEGGRG